MYDEQDREQQNIVGWVVGVAAFIAVAISLWIGLMGAFQDQKSSASATPGSVSSPATSSGPSTAVVGNLETVSLYFDVNKTMPPSDAAAKLDGLINYGRANQNAKIAISGYADKTGDPEKNAQLAKERALAVKNQLISAGMPEDRIMMQRPKEITADKADDRESRRVDVYVAQ
jgi:outer membrane protein OmpA-like peptidoglycan-associated protein